jgi:hypothetical protein
LIRKEEEPEKDSGTSEKLPRESSPEEPSSLASSTPLIKAPLQVSRILMNLHDRVRIYQLVWSMPMDEAGRMLGIGCSIRGVCEQLYIPHPGIGYWPKKASNKPVAPPPPLLQVQVRETGKIVEGVALSHLSNRNSRQRRRSLAQNHLNGWERARCRILPNAKRMPWSSASGRGGQPGM